MTFSIAGWDRETGDLGVAVASKFLAVGAVVPWVEAGVGAIATQALANVAYGPDGLDLLRRGEEAITAVQILIGPDAEREHRQVGIVDAMGRPVSYTGTECLDWAGGLTTEGAAIQGNILAGPKVVVEMERAWLETEGPLAERLLAALLAGDRAGGDRRGRQSAALVVKRAGAGYGGATDQLVDLRVDDHSDPVPELGRLLAIQDLLFGTTPEDEWLPIDDPLAARIRAALGLPAGGWDAETEAALKDWVGTENLEERWYGGDRIDPVVVAHLTG